MKTINDDRKPGDTDPVWCFLAEIAPSELELSGTLSKELEPALLLQAVQDSGIPPECLGEMEKNMAGFVNEVIGQFHQQKRTLPACMRLFCQKKAIQDKMSGGWGYFLIERGGDFPAGPAESAHNLVDLYLYKEGA